jgi:hypothetical protein
VIDPRTSLIALESEQPWEHSFGVLSGLVSGMVWASAIPVVALWSVMLEGRRRSRGCWWWYLPASVQLSGAPWELLSEH